MNLEKDKPGDNAQPQNPPQLNKYVKIHVCQASYGDCLAIEFDDKATVAGSMGLDLEEIGKKVKPKPATKPDSGPVIESKEIKDIKDNGKDDGGMEMESGKDKYGKDIRKPPGQYKLVPNKALQEQRQESQSRKVILIDGGPANYQIQGTVFNPATPLANMYAMLNSLLPPGCPNTLDTLVITHDDADHINGIHQMMMSMSDRSDEGTPEFQFHRGVEALESEKPSSPFRNIWYNSPTLLFKDEEAKGWFDLDLKRMKDNWPEAAMFFPDINGDFDCEVVSGKSEGAKAGLARRAHLQFDFLSPNLKQIANLKKQYKLGKGKKISSEDKDGKKKKGKEEKPVPVAKPLSKVGTKKARKMAKYADMTQGVEYKGLPNAMGTVPIYENDTLMKHMVVTEEVLERVAVGMKGKPKDTSAKNQSSLVFVVKDQAETFSAAFTGDGDAPESFLPLWTGDPLKYTVLKIMHHGSKHNNSWKKNAVETRIKSLGKEYKATQAFIHGSTAWKDKLPESCKTKGQDDPSRFFLNVLADKYIISSSTTEGHRNPHLSTLAGIITRAIYRYDEEKGPIDIFLTTQTLQAQIHGFLKTYGPEGADTIVDKDTVVTEKLLDKIMLRQPAEDADPELFWDDSGKYYRFWQLRDEMDPKFGTILLEPAGNNVSVNPAWQRVALSEAFYTAWHQGHFTTDCQDQVGRPLSKSEGHDKGHDGKQDGPKKRRGGRKPRGGAKPRGGSRTKRPKKKDNSRSDVEDEEEKDAGNSGGADNESESAPQKRGRKKLKGDTDTPKAGKGKGKGTKGKATQEVEEENIPRRKISRSKSTTRRLFSMEPDDYDTGVMSAEVESDMVDTIERLMPTDPSQGPKNSLMSNASDVAAVTDAARAKADSQMKAAWDVAVGARGLLPATFARFDIRVSELIYDTFSVQQGSETRILIGTEEFLKYLSLRGWLPPDGLTRMRTNYMRDGQINLVGIMSLIFDSFLMTSFFSLLPVTLNRKSLFSSTPMFWPLSEGLKMTVLSTPKRRNLAHDFSDVKSLSFSVRPPLGHDGWDINYRVAGGSMATWQVKVLSELHFFIHRPFERGFRYVYGSFLGRLSSGEGSNVIVDFLWFPDRDTALDYHLRLANNDFVADGYAMKVGDILSLIPSSMSTVKTLAAAVLLPGKDIPIAFGDLMSLGDCGFVVRKSSLIVADVTIKRIFGKIHFDQSQVFKPFGDMITIGLPEIGLQLENLYSTVPMKLFVRIQERLDIRGFPVPIVFESRRSRGGDRTVYQLSYIASSPEQGLTPARLLDWLGVSSRSFSDIPGLQKLLDSLRILSFGLGSLGDAPGKPRKESFSAQPNFIEFAIQLTRLELVPEYLAVENAFLEFRLDRSASGWKVSLTSYARITIGDCDVQFIISYGERPEWESVYSYDGIPGHFRLALATADTGVLSLSNILGHFMPNIQCLPPALHKVLTRTGISKFRLGVDKDEADKNEIAMIDLEVVMEEDDMEIFEGLEISRPTLNLRIDYPNDKDAIAINASISVRVEIEDEELDATIWLDSQEDTIIGMSIVPRHESIAIGEVIAFFTKKMAETFKLSMPSDLSFIHGIDAGPMHVSFRKTAETGYKLDSLLVHVEKNREFELWDSPRVVLSDVKLLINYIRGSGIHVGFGVSLAVGNYQFSGALMYDRASSGMDIVEEPRKAEGAPQEKGQVVALGKDKATAYTVQLDFRGEIGLHDILSRLTGTNFTEILQQTGLEAFSKYTDIKINRVALVLAKSPLSTTFSIAADLEWLAFTNVSLTASREATWAFNIQLQCKNGPLSILPDSWAATVARFVEFGDTSIYLFHGPIGNTLPGKQLELSATSRSMQGGVAITTSLNFGSDLEVLRKWLRVENLQVFGAAGTGFFMLGVKLGKLTLMDDAFKMSGSFLLSKTDQQLWIGIEGDFEFNIPAITKSTIAGTVAAGVNFSTRALALRYKSKNALKDIGGIKGFDLDAFAFELEIPPEGALVPTTVGVEGGVRIEGLDKVSGHLAVKFVAQNPLNSYIDGKMENLDLLPLLSKFAAAINLPSAVQNFLSKNGVNLRFLAIQLIPKDMIDMTNEVLKKRIYFEGALSIVIDDKPIWAGFMLLDIKDSGFTVIALMEPIQLIDPMVFSLRRSSKGVTAASVNLQLPQVKPEYLTPRMLSEGPVLKISSQGPDPVFVSAQLIFLGTEHDLYAVVNGDSFTAEFSSKSSVGSLTFTINCVLKSAIAIAATASLNLGLHNMPFVTTLSKLDGVLGSKIFNKTSEKATSVGFSGTLKIGVAWATGQDPLSISLSGSAHAFDKSWDLGEIGFKITENDLRSLERLTNQLWEYIKNIFSELVMKWIRAIGTAVTDAIKFVKDTWDVVSRDLIRLMSDIKEIPITEIIGPVVKELDMIYKDALNLYDDLGIGNFLGSKLLSFIYGKNPPPDRRPGWEPDVPDLENAFKFRPVPKPDDIIQPVFSRDDLLRGIPSIPGIDPPPKKPEPASTPAAPTPSDAFEIPDNFGFDRFSTFSLEPDFTSLLGTEPEDDEAEPEIVFVARVPAWYTNEVEQYVSSPMTAIPSDSVDETIAQIVRFNREEVIAIGKGLRIVGLSLSEVRQAYCKEFGHDMPRKMAEQIG